MRSFVLRVVLQNDLRDQLPVELVQLLESARHIMHEDHCIFKSRSAIRSNLGSEEFPASSDGSRPTSIESLLTQRTQINLLRFDLNLMVPGQARLAGHFARSR